MNGGGFVPNEADRAEGAGPPSVALANGGLSWRRVWLPRLLSRVAKVCFAGGLLGLALSIEASIVGDRLAGTVGAAFALLQGLAWPLWLASYVVSLTQFSYRGALEMSATELVVHKGDKRRAIPLAKISGALVVAREVFGAFVPTVEIELKNGDVLTARLPDPAATEAVVRKLGFGRDGKRVHAALEKPTRRLLHPLFAVGGYMAASTLMVVCAMLDGAFEQMFLLYPVLALGLYSALARSVRASTVTVGDDGVLVQGAFRRRFVGRKDIANVISTSAALVIETRRGDRIVVGGILLDAARRAAVARVIDERRVPSATAADRLAHYDRAGRGLAEWRAHLARSMHESSYRQNAATVDEAAAVLHSAEASREQRVGAALALRVAGQPKERIRVAVDGAVDDRMREALEAVAEAGDAEGDVVIEKALRRLQSP